MSNQLKDHLDEITTLRERLDALNATTSSSRRQMLDGNQTTTLPPPLRPRAIYTIKRLASELDVSERTIRRLVTAGRIKTVPISIGRIGIPQAEFQKIIAGNLLNDAEPAA